MITLNGKVIRREVKRSLIEDVQTGDITAQLVPCDQFAHASVITREDAVICGQPWFNDVFRRVDQSVEVIWHVNEGGFVKAGEQVVECRGFARSILTAERTALNWLQTLSGTATTVHQYVEQLRGTKAMLLDTRKTIPNLRYAQKYAVTCGGGHNHRMGLFDAFLIKENHIQSAGSITAAVNNARALGLDKKIEVEVENFEQLAEAIAVKADVVMLDNFAIADLPKAVSQANGRVKLEVSGNVDLTTLHEIAKTGVDFISVGGLTKHLRAVDFSMRFLAV